MTNAQRLADIAAPVTTPNGLFLSPSREMPRSGNFNVAGRDIDFWCKNILTLAVTMPAVPLTPPLHLPQQPGNDAPLSARIDPAGRAWSFMNVHEQFKLSNLNNLEIDVSALFCGVAGAGTCA